MDGEEADPAVELEAGDLVDQAAPGGKGRCARCSLYFYDF